MKLKLVKRVFQDNKCVGYYVSNGTKTMPVNIDMVYKYVQNNSVANVGLKIVNGAPVLYGINGFKIEDLPIEKLTSTKKQTANISIVEVYRKDNKDVGYTLSCNGKTIKVSRDKMLEYDKAGKIVRESLKTAKVINEKTEVDYTELFRKSGITDKARKCIKVISAMNTGDKTEIDEIVSIVNSLKDASSHWSKSKEAYIAELNTRLNYIDTKTQRSIAAVRVNNINTITAKVQAEMTRAARLKTAGGNKVVEHIKKSIIPDVVNLSKCMDFDAFMNLYKQLDNKLVTISKKIREFESVKAQNIAETNKRVALANDIIQSMNKNDELYNEKVKIVKEPWCLNNRAFLQSSKYLENCYVTDKETKKDLKLSFKNVTFKETISNNRRTGFEVRYKDKVYYYRQALNNMNLLAAFLKVAEDENILGNSSVSIKVRSGGESKIVPLGV